MTLACVRASAVIPPILVEAFGKMMRARRREKKQTQVDAAEEIGVSEQTLRSWEHGRYPTLGTAFRAADYLGKKVDELRKVLEEAPVGGQLR